MQARNQLSFTSAYRPLLVQSFVSVVCFLTRCHVRRCRKCQAFVCDASAHLKEKHPTAVGPCQPPTAYQQADADMSEAPNALSLPASASGFSQAYWTDSPDPTDAPMSSPEKVVPILQQSAKSASGCCTPREPEGQCRPGNHCVMIELPAKPAPMPLSPLKRKLRALPSKGWVPCSRVAHCAPESLPVAVEYQRVHVQR